MARGWFQVSYDLTQGDRIPDAIRQLAQAVESRRGFSDFFRAILTRGVPEFFREMFEARGSGGTFYGRSWKPLSAAWKQEKAAAGWDPRIGYRKSKLFTSLTQPGSRESVLRITDAGGLYGTRVRDNTASKRVAYADFFNQVRPFLDRKTMQDLKDYLLNGNGKSAFTGAEKVLISNLLSRVRHGTTGGKFFRKGP